MAEYPDTNVRVDDEITAEEVRVIDRGGDQLGIMRLEDAREIASEREWALVEVESGAEPPVCRFMSRDEIARRFGADDGASEPRRPTVLREIRLASPSDFDEAIVAEARGHMEHGDELKVTLREIGRGPEAESAKAVFAEIAQALEDIAIVEVPLERAGRDLVAFFAPR